MNMIQTIFESIQTAMKQTKGELPPKLENYAIGSGSNFVIHKNITYNQARKKYEEYKKRLGSLGKQKDKKDLGNYIIESFHTLESTTGITYVFMFEVNKIIEHDPNIALTEMCENKNTYDKIINQIAESLTK